MTAKKYKKIEKHSFLLIACSLLLTSAVTGCNPTDENTGKGTASSISAKNPSSSDAPQNSRTKDEKSKQSADATGVMNAHDFKVQFSDSSTVVVGNIERDKSGNRAFVAKFNSEGKLDPKFASHGYFVTDAMTYPSLDRVYLQDDGKILAAGIQWEETESFVLLVRLKPDGTRDPSFGNDGIVRTSVLNTRPGSTKSNLQYVSIDMHSDGRFVVSVNNNWMKPGNVYGFDIDLIQYLSDGSLDSSFGTNGIVNTRLGNTNGDAEVHDLRVYPNGKIAAVGDIAQRYRAIIRYNLNGTLDSSFGNNGIVQADPSSYLKSRLWSIALQSDNKIVVGGNLLKATSSGSNQPYVNLSRLNEDGTLDSSFGISGHAEIPATGQDDRMIAIQLTEHEKILSLWTAGGSASSHLLRFNSNGTIDSGFGEAGTIELKSESITYPPRYMTFGEDNKNRILVLENLYPTFNLLRVRE